tara:strand:- start:33457 stop:34008 length:552 start_codon:yes stop_codon:yes gene_type:complete
MIKNILKSIFNKCMSNKSLFKIFGKIYLKNYTFQTFEEIILDTGFGYSKSSSSITLPINNIFGILKGNKMYERTTIENSPHFQFIDAYLNNKKTSNIYKDYLRKNFPNLDPSEKEINFINLAKSIRENSDEVFLLLKKEEVLLRKKEGKIIDGLHRASILKSLKQDNVKCFIADNLINYPTST